MANQETLGGSNPHEEIVQLQEHIEKLAAKMESCRKFILELQDLRLQHPQLSAESGDTRSRNRGQPPVI